MYFGGELPMNFHKGTSLFCVPGCTLQGWGSGKLRDRGGEKCVRSEMSKRAKSQTKATRPQSLGPPRGSLLSNKGCTLSVLVADWKMKVSQSLSQ